MCDKVWIRGLQGSDLRGCRRFVTLPGRKGGDEFRFQLGQTFENFPVAVNFLHKTAKVGFDFSKALERLGVGHRGGNLLGVQLLGGQGGFGLFPDNHPGVRGFGGQNGFRMAVTKHHDALTFVSAHKTVVADLGLPKVGERSAAGGG